MDYGHFANKWEIIASSTGPSNKDYAENALTLLYKSLGYKKPEFKWVDSPFNPDIEAYASKRDGIENSAAKFYEYLIRGGSAHNVWIRDDTPRLFSAISSILDSTKAKGISCFDPRWPLMQFNKNDNTFAPRTINKPNRLHTAIAFTGIAILEEVPWIRMFDDACFISERPARVSVVTNDLGRKVLSDHKEPAFVWGHKVFYLIDGVQVPKHFVKHPESVTLRDCTHFNAEVRRVAIDIFGRDKFLEVSRARLIDKDERYGKLWLISLPSTGRRRWNDIREMWMLEVVNRSPEPDGSFKTYYLKVPPPDMIAQEFMYAPPQRTAREAVAWTCHCRWDEYDPEIET